MYKSENHTWRFWDSFASLSIIFELSVVSSIPRIVVHRL